MNVGIDVGGTNLKAGLVDESGEMVAVSQVPLGIFQEPEAFAKSLADLVKAAAQQANIAPGSVESVGMGIPGAVNEGRIVYTCNIPMENVPVSALFRRYLDVPVFLGNDADCAAVGEYFCGAGRGTKHFVMITLGTGIGGGLIVNGKLYTGIGSAGEVGHMVIVQDGEPCNCGRRGCWERYASATGLIWMTKQAMKDNPGSLLHQVARKSGAVDGRTAFEAAQQGDATAKALCKRYVDYLATGIANLINILQPEMLAIGGGVSGAPDELLLHPLQERVAQESYGHRCVGRSTRIVKAELGNGAGIIGAAFLHQAQ